jgi:hypothetical protein
MRLTLLTTTTTAVHHRCITGTAFGGIWRNRRSTRNRMVEPNLPIRWALAPCDLGRVGCEPLRIAEANTGEGLSLRRSSGAWPTGFESADVDRAMRPTPADQKLRTATQLHSCSLDQGMPLASPGAEAA